METKNANELLITRTFNAPRQLVFDAFTKPEHLAHWWGPVGFELTVIKMDLREGGQFHYSMKNEQGYELFGLFLYKKIDAPNSIEFTNGFADKNGAFARSAFLPVFPLEVYNTWTFTEKDGKTTLALSGRPYQATEEETKAFMDLRANMDQGFGGTFDQLESYLNTLNHLPNTNGHTANRELTMERLLNAPISLVWQVWTEPEHIKNWWGPNGFTNSIDTMEVKAGGNWEFVMHGPDGTDYKNKSRFIEVVKPNRIVYEHINAPKHKTTITFIEQGNKTLLHWHMLFESAEQREQVVKTFKADEGLKQNGEKLEVYLQQLQHN